MWGLIWLLRPVLQLREAIERLANRDFRPVILRHPLGFFRRSAANVRQISELLERQDQKITDEGFSLRAILSSMAEGVLIVDPGQRIRLINDAAVRMFNLRSSPVNRSVIEVFLHHELRTALDATLRDGRPRKVELTFRSPGGGTEAERFFEVYASALNPGRGGAAMGAVVVFHDLTQLRRLEAVRREFVANVSHEFRTPLAIINGYIETLLDGAVEDPAMTGHSLQVMHKHAKRLNLLIDDLLVISTLEHGSAQLDFRPVELRGVLERVIEQMGATIEERGARVTVDFPPEGAVVEVDARRIEQVFFNLLTNALRYGATRDARISVVAREAGGMLEVAFTDNGPGIPYEDQSHIFERFYRVHKDRSRDAGGTGLGLSIVKNAVLAHGGTVAVESTPGNGATFTVSLPLRQTNPDAKA